MAWFASLRLVVLTPSAALVGVWLFHFAGFPLPFILGPMAAAAVVANGLALMRCGKRMRRGGQLFVGASAGAVIGADGVAEMVRLLPMMLGAAVASIAAGLLVAVPMARVAGIDRASAALACLPAGMAEMATLARELGCDEQAVALIHTLRVVMVMILVPLWLGATGGVALPVAASGTPLDILFIAGLVAVSFVLALALGAARLRITNPWIIVPMLLSLGLVAGGVEVPPVPGPVLVAAQIAIGTSQALRFRLDQMRQFPRIAAAGVVSGLVLMGVAFFALTPLVKAVAGIDRASVVLAVAPGGLGEMIAAATSLGLLAASVAGFQLTRSILTNLVMPPILRAVLHR
jgi:membrane AbrB-like protein